jgi:hypothetical protein
LFDAVPVQDIPTLITRFDAWLSMTTKNKPGRTAADHVRRATFAAVCDFSSSVSFRQTLSSPIRPIEMLTSFRPDHEEEAPSATGSVVVRQLHCFITEEGSAAAAYGVLSIVGQGRSPGCVRRRERGVRDAFVLRWR